MGFNRVYIILLFCIFSSYVIAQDSYNPCGGDNQAFQDGEELVYKIYYNWGLIWLIAGEVRFQVRAYNDKYQLKATGTTYSSYEWFFKVNDRYESEVDKRNLLPHWAIKDVQEGDYKKYDELSFDHDALQVRSKRGSSRWGTKEKIYPIEPCEHDILSLIYQLRTTDVTSMEIGAHVPMHFFLDGESYQVKMTYEDDDEKYKIKGLGKFRAYRFTPELVGGDIFQEGSKMSILVSKDENKIPLLIESPLKVGSIKAILTSHKGVRNEMAKI